MSIDISVDSMTVAEKLQLMEVLWNSLAKNPSDVPSPYWHGDVLELRRKAIAEGRATIECWDDVKQRLRARYE